MDTNNNFEIDICVDSPFESPDILQDTYDDNMTTAIATTSNDMNIASNISDNPVNKKSRSQPSPLANDNVMVT
ncbi:24113_t:CDS:2, partial [Dentiscutata erythropus]